MITQIDNVPDNMVGFLATGVITESDYNDIVMPKVNTLVEKTNKLNFLLVLDTSIKNFTAEAWMKDAALGLKNLFKWNRAAIVTDVSTIRGFTDSFSIFVPGEFKGFEQKDIQTAIDWTSGKI